MAQPEKVLEKIPGAVGVTKSMLLELIRYSQITLPCRLSPDLLADICAEIDNYHGAIENQHQFARALPKLAKYLNQFPIEGINNTDQWLSKLASISSRLDVVLTSDQEYLGRWEELLHYHSLGLRYESQLEREADREGIEELERYQEEVRKKHGLKPINRQSSEGVKEGEVFNFEQVKKQLRSFTSLLKEYEQAQQLLGQYQEMQNLMLRSVSLPPAQSDLLMRYQTTLERRLSSAIGELLELQRRGQGRAQ